MPGHPKTAVLGVNIGEVDDKQRVFYLSTMTSEELKVAWGRKVFFLYPHSVFNNELLLELLANQYEIYVLRKHEDAWRAAEKYPGSILLVNIDEGLSEKEWEAWIRKLLADPKRAQTKVGILTYDSDQVLARKYLMDISVPCGFIQLKQGMAKSKKIILETLEANEARGRRRYVRARCPDPRKAAFNMRVGGKLVNGHIRDISPAGMSFHLDRPAHMKANAALDDIQLKLKGVVCRVSGIYVGEMKEGPRRDLLMFKQPVPPDTVDKIHRFIFYSLQQELDTALGYD